MAQQAATGEEPTGKTPLGRPKPRWKDCVKKYVEYI